MGMLLVRHRLAREAAAREKAKAGEYLSRPLRAAESADLSASPESERETLPPAAPAPKTKPRGKRR